jgi:hypothetical protein
MPQRRYSAEQVDAAVRALALDGERFAHAQEIVTHAAPDEALRAGGFFGAAHDAEVARVAAIEPAEQRVTGVRTLVAEEARMGMLVGVAVGLGLGEQLRRSSGDEHDERSSAT